MSVQPTSATRPVWPRLVASVLWLAALAGAFWLLWLGLTPWPPIEASTFCSAVDGRFIAAGVSAILVVAAIGWLALGSRLGAALIATAGVVIVVLLLAFQCSLVPLLSFFPLAALALGGAVVVLVEFLRPHGPSDRRDTFSP